jgi:hypothetical protein
MTKPVFVTPEGRLLVDYTPAPPANDVEPEPLYVLAAREAAKQSTKTHQ